MFLIHSRGVTETCVPREFPDIKDGNWITQTKTLKHTEITLPSAQIGRETHRGKAQVQEMHQLPCNLYREQFCQPPCMHQILTGGFGVG